MQNMQILAQAHHDHLNEENNQINLLKEKIKQLEAANHQKSSEILSLSQKIIEVEIITEKESSESSGLKFQSSSLKS